MSAINASIFIIRLKYYIVVYIQYKLYRENYFQFDLCLSIKWISVIIYNIGVYGYGAFIYYIYKWNTQDLYILATLLC